jgi:hypothetical protein
MRVVAVFAVMKKVVNKKFFFRIKVLIFVPLHKKKLLLKSYESLQEFHS